MNERRKRVSPTKFDALASHRAGAGPPALAGDSIVLRLRGGSRSQQEVETFSRGHHHRARSQINRFRHAGDLLEKVGFEVLANRSRARGQCRLTRPRRHLRDPLARTHRRGFCPCAKARRFRRPVGASDLEHTPPRCLHHESRPIRDATLIAHSLEGDRSTGVHPPIWLHRRECYRSNPRHRLSSRMCKLLR